MWRDCRKRFAGASQDDGFLSGISRSRRHVRAGVTRLKTYAVQMDSDTDAYCKRCGLPTDEGWVDAPRTTLADREL